MEWKPMKTAPKNPYGERWGPLILIFCGADHTVITAQYDPWYSWEDQDCGPAWVIPDQDPPLDPKDAVAWCELPTLDEIGDQLMEGR